MATSLGDLLDTLVETARATPCTPLARADAGTALRHIGRALTQLRADGLTPTVHDIREQRVAALATTCAELAARAPATESSLARLAAAAADTVAVQRDQATSRTRWAVAVELADVARVLADLITPAVPGPVAQWCAVLQHAALQVEHSAARHPPTREGFAGLDQPVPFPTRSRHVEIANLIHEATATLLNATRPGSEPLSLAQLLAVTFAAETLSDAAQLRLVGRPIGPPASGSIGTAGEAWQTVRFQLRPFNDGSRRRQTDRPAAVSVALELHGALRRQDPTAPDDAATTALVRAIQHLPALATNLHAAVSQWAKTGTLFAYACELPPRDDRITQQLAGRRLTGLIRAESIDLLPTSEAIFAARLLSRALAADVIERHGTGSRDARRTVAANQAWTEKARGPKRLSLPRVEAPRVIYTSRSHDRSATGHGR
jgi:hypothetical protein